MTHEPISMGVRADHGPSAEPEAVAAMPGSTGGLQPPAPPVDTVRDDTAMPDDAEVTPTPEEANVDLVAMARDIFGDMLADAPAEADESRGWECWVGPGHQPVHRADGSTYCQTCHPPTVGRSDGPTAASTRRPTAT